METYLFTSAFSIFAFAASSIIVQNRRYKRLPGFFIAFVVLVSVRCIFWLLVHSNDPVFGPLWLGFLMWTTLLVTPCAWLFAQEIHRLESPRLSELHVRHYLVLVAGFVCLLPLLSSMTFNAVDVSRDRNMWLLVNGANLLCAVIYMVQAPYYWLKSIRILKLHSEEGLNNLLRTSRNPNINALRLVLISVAATWCVSVLLVVHCMTLGGPTSFSLALSSIEVIVAVGALLFIMQRVPENTSDRKTETQLELEPKYARSSLSSEDRKRILKKIEEELNKQCYLNNILTLRVLSDSIAEKSHYVSQVINQDLDTSFFDLVNRRRIIYAQDLLKADPKCSILEASERSGFNSKSTFNTAFRKYTQMTPTQYRSTP